MKIITPYQACRLIEDNNILAVNGMLQICGCDTFYKALAERYKEEKRPKDISLYSTTCLGVTYLDRDQLANRLTEPGLIKALYSSYYTDYKPFHSKILNNEIEAYIYPQGIQSQMVESAARKIPFTISKIGLGTFLEENHGKLNKRSTRVICDKIDVDSECYMRYNTIYPDI